MSQTPKFCFVCGVRLKMSYPGNDPENGPAALRCPDGHDTVQNEIETHLMLAGLEDPGEYLANLRDGVRQDPHDLVVPDDVKAAAEKVLGFREQNEAHWDNLFEEMAEETK